jgi:hypothetical protein
MGQHVRQGRKDREIGMAEISTIGFAGQPMLNATNILPVARDAHESSVTGCAALINRKPVSIPQYDTNGLGGSTTARKIKAFAGAAQIPFREESPLDLENLKRVADSLIEDSIPGICILRQPLRAVSQSGRLVRTPHPALH